jgi:hypothetical protein
MGRACCAGLAAAREAAALELAPMGEAGRAQARSVVTERAEQRTVGASTTA